MKKIDKYKNNHAIRSIRYIAYKINGYNKVIILAIILLWVLMVIQIAAEMLYITNNLN